MFQSFHGFAARSISEDFSTGGTIGSAGVGAGGGAGGGAVSSGGAAGGGVISVGGNNDFGPKSRESDDFYQGRERDRSRERDDREDGNHQSISTSHTFN